MFSIRHLNLVLKRSYLPKYTNYMNVCIKQYFHTEHLKSRSLLIVSGENVANFLQGMVTNDINHISEIDSSMYSMILNVQGRVLFDTIIYRNSEEQFLLECDSNVVGSLSNHLKLHKVRRKINFEISKKNIWVIFEDKLDTKSLMKTDLEALYVSPISSLPDSLMKCLPSNSKVYKDPRLQYLGHRIILEPSQSLENISGLSICNHSYKTLRYKLGVGEGVEELPRAKCLPFEANSDYLHGVSFQKGCYVGQELTARTYHTGVVRKRYMPIILSKPQSLEPNQSITNEKGKSVGKVIKTSEQLGIALMRLPDCLNALSLKAADAEVTTFKPGWWPIEASSLIK